MDLASRFSLSMQSFHGLARTVVQNHTGSFLIILSFISYKCELFLAYYSIGCDLIWYQCTFSERTSNEIQSISSENYVDIAVVDRMFKKTGMFLASKLYYVLSVYPDLKYGGRMGTGQWAVDFVNLVIQWLPFGSWGWIKCSTLCRPFQLLVQLWSTIGFPRIQFFSSTVQVVQGATGYQFLVITAARARSIFPV